MLEVVKELPVEQFPPRPSLTARKAVIKAEAVKPKSSYYLKNGPRVPNRQRYNPRFRRTNYASQKTHTPSAPKTAPKSAVPISATTTLPVPTSRPIITKPLKTLPPSQFPQGTERDWVKQRLGR